MSTIFPPTVNLQNAVDRSYLFENYLDKSIEPILSNITTTTTTTTTTDTCFSEEESDSSNSTKSFHDQKLNKHVSKKREPNTTKKEDIDSDNDSLIEYSKNKKNNKKKMNTPVENEKKQKSLYKTELCRNWEETGQCRYGMKCQYAHGAQDLREIERHPKYKTQKCRTFHKTGSCPYGARCTFRHFSLPGDALEMKEEEEAAAAAAAAVSMFDSNQMMFPSIFANESRMFQPTWYPETFKRPFATNYDLEDSLLPSNAESLLPHQLLFDLDNSYPTSQIPNYQQHYQPNDETLCKSFFRPWLI
ncbi:hypothetical protein G6F56_008943 [Rhizopus delemar]|nr:hypothetical protein G6F56_008943 [Rhizopus delemar]